MIPTRTETFIRDTHIATLTGLSTSWIDLRFSSKSKFYLYQNHKIKLWLKGVSLSIQSVQMAPSVWWFHLTLKLLILNVITSHTSSKLCGNHDIQSKYWGTTNGSVGNVNGWGGGGPLGCENQILLALDNREGERNSWAVRIHVMLEAEHLILWRSCTWLTPLNAQWEAQSRCN